MRFGELNHSAELGTEGIAVGEVTGLYRKAALPVNVDGRRLGHRFGWCIGLAFGLTHACGPWSVRLMPYSYLNRVGGASAARVAAGLKRDGRNAANLWGQRSSRTIWLTGKGRNSGLSATPGAGDVAASGGSNAPVRKSRLQIMVSLEAFSGQSVRSSLIACRGVAADNSTLNLRPAGGMPRAHVRATCEHPSLPNPPCRARPSGWQAPVRT